MRQSGITTQKSLGTTMTKTEKPGNDQKMLGVGTHIRSISRRKLMVSRTKFASEKTLLLRSLASLEMLGYHRPS